MRWQHASPSLVTLGVVDQSRVSGEEELPSVFMSGHLRQSVEHCPKVALIAESHLQGDLSNSFIGRDQQVPCFLNAEGLEIPQQRLPVTFLKKRVKVRLLI